MKYLHRIIIFLSVICLSFWIISNDVFAQRYCIEEGSMEIGGSCRLFNNQHWTGCFALCPAGWTVTGYGTRVPREMPQPQTLVCGPGERLETRTSINCRINGSGSCANNAECSRCVGEPARLQFCTDNRTIETSTRWATVAECTTARAGHTWPTCYDMNHTIDLDRDCPREECPDCPPGTTPALPNGQCPIGHEVVNVPGRDPECPPCCRSLRCECPPEMADIADWIAEGRIISVGNNAFDREFCGENARISQVRLFGPPAPDCIGSCGMCEPEVCPIPNPDFDGVGTAPAIGQEGLPCPPGQRVTRVEQYGNLYCGLCEPVPDEELCPPGFGREEVIPPGRSGAQVAQQSCENIGGDNPWTLRPGWQTVNRPAPQPDLVCFDCDPPPVCVCPPNMHQTPEAACAGIPEEHNPRAVQRLVPAVSAPPRTPDPCNRQRVPCYECRSTPPNQRDNAPCAPFVHARTRATGYIVSDPDGLAQTIWTQDGSMRCGFPFGGLAESVLDGVTRPGGIMGGTDPLTFADINLIISPDPGATLLRRAQIGTTLVGRYSYESDDDDFSSLEARAGINSVGRYSFINLPWNNFGSPASDPPPSNPPGYTITLTIDNTQRAGNDGVADSQIGTWVCSCPGGLGGDPFTCQYEGLEVPKPDSTCPGIGGVNTSPPVRRNHPFNPPVGPWGEGRYGAFTRGAENTLIPPFGDRRYITDMDCRNPAANFFLTVWDTSNAPWWQAAAGHVYADQNIISNIPAQTSIMDQGGDQDYTRCALPHCTPYMIRDNRYCVAPSNNPLDRTAPARSYRAGYPIIGGRVPGGNINAGTMGGNGTARGGTGGSTQNSRVVSSLHGPREDFAHFYGLMPSGNFRTITNINQIGQCNGENVACIVRGNLTISNGTNITIPSGAKHSIFVTGDLNIGDPGVLCLDAACYMNDYVVNMYIEQGGWLGFIVQGNINVASSVGRYNKRLISFSGGDMRFDTTRPVCFGDYHQCCGAPEGTRRRLNYCDNTGIIRQPCNNNERGTIQGVFFADGAININANPIGGLFNVGRQTCNPNIARIPDKKFIGEGTFVGWSGVNLLRDFNDHCSFTQAWNSRSPTESFIYRPDFLLNVPDWMRRSLRLRQEML